MDNIKTEAAGHHEQAAHALETAAKMHRDAAHQCLSGNYGKAQSLATSAAEADTVASRHAMDAVNLYRHHAEGGGRPQGRNRQRGSRTRRQARSQGRSGVGRPSAPR